MSLGRAKARLGDQLIRLESLRQDAQLCGGRASSLYDYLDRGNPDPQQRREAMVEIADCEERSAEIRQQLRETIAALRTDEPQAVEEWVAWHMSMLEHIIEEGAADPDARTPGSDPAVRLHVAKETLEQWKQVLAGTLHFVHINDYYLSDYNDDVTAAVSDAGSRR